MNLLEFTSLIFLVAYALSDGRQKTGDRSWKLAIDNVRCHMPNSASDFCHRSSVTYITFICFNFIPWLM